MQKLVNNRLGRTVAGAFLILTVSSGSITSREVKSLPDQFLSRPVLFDKAEELIRAKLSQPLERLRSANFRGNLTVEKEALYLREIAKAIREIEAETTDPLIRSVVEDNVTEEQFRRLSRLLQ